MFEMLPQLDIRKPNKNDLDDFIGEFAMADA